MKGKWFGLLEVSQNGTVKLERPSFGAAIFRFDDRFISAASDFKALCSLIRRTLLFEPLMRSFELGFPNCRGKARGRFQKISENRDGRG